MKLLITGNRGFIGSHAVSYFHKQGHEVTTYDWHPDMLPRIQGYDAVLHFGAISSTTETDVAKVMRQNYDFSVWLYEECCKYKVDLQWSSSASVYGLSENFHENAPVDPRTPYAWSKYLFERYVDQHPADIRVQGFRYFNVYGANEQHKGTQASPFYQFNLQAQVNGVIKVFEDSENYYRDFVPVEDVILTHNVFLQGIKDSGIWNLGTGQCRSFLSVAEEIANKHNARIETIPMPENLKNSYQKFTCADITKLSKTLHGEEKKI